MPTANFGDRQFELVRASDVVRDGMGLELWDVTAGARTHVLEAFYRDEDGRFSFSAYEPDLPFDAVEWFVAQARDLLPPAPNPRAG